MMMSCRYGGYTLKPQHLESLPLCYDNSQGSMMLVDTPNHWKRLSNAAMPRNVHCTITERYKKPRAQALGVIHYLDVCIVNVAQMNQR